MALILGTAGHVDHGKTSLIKALTGVDTDRLPEEKQRGMTIDIGFASLNLHGVGRVSIVDVPGHERFLTNMLVGALAMDTALLCIAADEGVMPQTREHMQILELLPLRNLAVAITKCDLVEPELLELAIEEIREWLKTTRFEGATLVPVSSTTDAGIADLKKLLAGLMKSPPPVSQSGWILPVDRAFVVNGHGLVVTGSLLGGSVELGDDAIVMPGSLKGRVKSIQCHEESVGSAEPGGRTAVNLTGIKFESVERGMIVGKPGHVVETTCLDLKVNWVREPRHGMTVRVAIGAADVLGKLFLNDNDTSLAQVHFEAPCAAAKGLPVIIRRHSPPDILGGGTVAAPIAARRRKNAVPPVDLAVASDEGLIVGLAAQTPLGLTTEEVCDRLGRSPQSLGDVFETLKSTGQLVGFSGTWFTPETLAEAWQKLEKALSAIHAADPAKPAFPRDMVLKQARIPWSGKVLERLISHWQAEGVLRVSGSSIGLASHRVTINAKQAALLERISVLLDQAGVAVPRAHEIAESLGIPVQAVAEVMKTGVDAGLLVRVDEDLIYTTGGLETIWGQTKAVFEATPFAAAQFRDHFPGASRRHTIPLLEHFDARGFTIRQGDLRRIV